MMTQRLVGDAICFARQEARSGDGLPPWHQRRTAGFQTAGVERRGRIDVSRDGMGSEEMSGRVLATSGLLVQLGDEWRAEVVEIQEQ